jgi:FeS assembly protein IscX
MKWIDSDDIAIALEEKYSEIDILSVRFTDLKKWVEQLDEFDDDPKKCNEKILENIQMTWLSERD